MKNDMIPGTSSYRNGFNAAVFRPETDAALGWLKAAGDPQVVRTYYLDLPATEKIIDRARALRQQAGTITGYAAGQDDADPPQDFLADVLSVFAGDKLWCSTLAARLTGHPSGAYADVTQEAVASQLRALGVTVC